MARPRGAARWSGSAKLLPAARPTGAACRLTLRELVTVISHATRGAAARNPNPADIIAKRHSKPSQRRRSSMGWRASTGKTTCDGLTRPSAAPRCARNDRRACRMMKAGRRWPGSMLRQV